MFAPKPDTLVTQLNADYAVNSFLMAWGQTLVNTALYPLDPKPVWFDPIATELTAAQMATRTWLVNDYPSIAAALPQSLIDYANLFGPAVDEIAPLLARKPLASGDRAQLVALFTALQSEAQDQSARVATLRGKVDQFAKMAAAKAEKLSGQSRDVIQSLAEDRRQVLALQARIAELQHRLGLTTEAAKRSMSGAATTGASLTMTLMAFTIQAGVGAAAFPVFGLVGAFIGIAFNAAMEAAKSEEVLQAVREINDLTLKLNKVQAQAAALETMATSLQNLRDVVGASFSNMVGTAHHWDDVNAGLGLALELLAQPAVDLTLLSPFANIRAAAADWRKIAAGANKVQGSVLKVAPDPIVVGGAAA